MNIIEAIQYAEHGKLITNRSLFGSNHFIEYVKDGDFREFKIIADDKVTPIATFQKFNMEQILSLGWSLVRELKLQVI